MSPLQGIKRTQPPAPPPKAPTAEAWHAMTPAERERLLVEILDALSDPQSALSEGRQHKKAKEQALDMLTLHFGATGRVIYLTDRMAVLYPGEEVFVPDILAVTDVPQPEDDQRMAWVVAEEGKGLDLVLEVLHQGDRRKDLVDNVERYARLGIPEYFVYDRLRQQIHGYRLPGAGAGAPRYQRIMPQAGLYRSNVLGLDLAILGGRLRFYHGMAELFGTTDLIGQLKGMIADLETKADQAQAQADQAFAASLRQAILALAEARQLPCSDQARARLSSCTDPSTLQRWLLRATTAISLDEALSASS